MTTLQWWHRGSAAQAAADEAAPEAVGRGTFSLHTSVLQPHR